MVSVLEFSERVKTLGEIDFDTLGSCIPDWFMGGLNDSYVGCVKNGLHILLLPDRVRVSHNWIEQDHIEDTLADSVIRDIVSVPPIIMFKQPIDTEGIMLYDRCVSAHLEATNNFSIVKKHFSDSIVKGFSLDMCTCQLSYSILRPLVHWIETPTFLNTIVDWYYDTNEGIYWKLEKCTTSKCVMDYLDIFLENMKKLNAQLPDVSTPVLYISSPVNLSISIKEFSGEWFKVGENIKSVKVKICEEGETHIKFYMIDHPNWLGKEQTEMINVVGETTYTFDPSYIPKRVTFKSVPAGAKIFVVKKS